MSLLNVTFPGGMKVNARIEGFDIATDQPLEDGGDNSAPAPYYLFLASIATCAGYYVRAFCQQRGLPTEGLGMTLDIDRNAQTRRLEKVRLAVQLPPEFPEKYKSAIIRAAGMCSVKKAISDPPEFEVITE